MRSPGYGVGRALLALLLMGWGVLAQAQEKPLRIIVPFGPGSGLDIVARVVAAGITKDTGQPVVVDNKPGANGFLAVADLVKSPADGATVIFSSNTIHAANQHLLKKIPYDPAKDFTPLTGLARGDVIMVVHPAAGYESVGRFVGAGKARAKPVTFGSGTASARVGAELFKSMSGLDMTWIPYKSNPNALQDLMGQMVDVVFADAATALPLIKSGRLQALAVGGSRHSAYLPGIPTLEESGYKGYEMSYWWAAYAPAGLPKAVQDRLAATIQKAARRPEAAEVWQSSGVDPYFIGPAELARLQASEADKWGRIIRQAGIEPE